MTWFNGPLGALPLAVCAFLLALTDVAHGAATERGAADLQRFTLSNGIEVLLLPDATSRVVTSVAVLGAGSAYEPARGSGASHFLEHMLFNGTSRRTQEELYAETDFYGAFNNAFTRRHHVAFMLTVPRRFLGRGLDLQADMLFHSTLPPENFEKERGIILEELVKDRESGSYELDSLLDAETFPGSGYGLPVVGSESSIEEMTREEVLGFYATHYVPGRMRLLLLGGCDPVMAADSLEHYFGSVRASSEPWQAAAVPAPLVASRVIRHELELSSSRVRMVWNAPAPEAAEFLAAQAAAALCLGDASTPLAQAVTAQFPNAVLSWSGRIEGGPGFDRLILDVDVTPGTDLAALAEAIVASADMLAAPSEERITAYQVSQRAALIFARQRGYMFAPLYSETVALEGTRGLETLADRTAAITQADIANVRLCAGPHCAILVAASAEAPATPAAQSGMPRAMPPTMPAGMAPTMPATMPAGMRTTMPPAAMQGMPAATASPAAPGSSQPPSPGAKRPPLLMAGGTEDAPPYTVIDSTLASGARLLLLHTPPSEVLTVYVLIEGRNYLEPGGLEGVTELLQNLMGLATASRDEAAFAHELQSMGAELQTADRAELPFDDRYTRRDFSFVRFQCLDMFAPRAFALLGEMLQTPSLDPALIERVRGQLRARVARERGQSRTLAQAELAQLLYPAGHPEARSVYGDSLSLTRITRDDVAAYHARLLDPRRIWVAVASSRPAGEIAAAVAALLPLLAREPSPTLGFTPQRLAQWQSRGELGTGLADRLPKLAGDHPLALGGERGYVLEAVLLPAELTARPAGRAAAEIACGAYASRLVMELRETRGLAYSIGASLDRMGDRWLCIAAAGTRASQVDAMRDGFADVRRNVAQTPLPRATLAREANALYGSQLRRQESRLNQAMEAVWAAREAGDPLAWWSDSARLLAASPGEVEAALKALDAPGTAVTVTVR
jgi:predicted Zn-dependent peptidase